MPEITTLDMETVDLALWRAGQRAPGAVEAALDANRGLAARPPVLPPRVTITLPAPAKASPKPTVKLWD